jgi:hypothetical protein
MIDQGKFNKTLERVYEAAARPKLWPLALADLAAAAHGMGALMLHHRPEGASLHAASESMGPYLKAFFAEGWNRNNPRERRARALRVDVDAIMTDEWLDDPSDARFAPWRKDFLGRFGLRHFLSFNLLGVFAPAPFMLTIERRGETGPFVADEIETVKAALPHSAAPRG